MQKKIGKVNQTFSAYLITKIVDIFVAITIFLISIYHDKSGHLKLIAKPLGNLAWVKSAALLMKLNPATLNEKVWLGHLDFILNLKSKIWTWKNENVFFCWSVKVDLKSRASDCCVFTQANCCKPVGNWTIIWQHLKQQWLSVHLCSNIKQFSLINLHCLAAGQTWAGHWEYLVAQGYH